MVRLVFRPYTQIRREICTLPSLRASTRVSPGFTLFRHRSPSFGSQQICSYSNLSQVINRSIVPLWLFTKDSYLKETSSSSLSFCIRVLLTQILAYMLDSLVRVSRRVDENHFIRIAKNTNGNSKSIHSFINRTALLSKPIQSAGLGAQSGEPGAFSFPQSASLYHPWTVTGINSLPFHRPSPRRAN